MNIRFTDDMNPARASKVANVLLDKRLWIPTADDYGGGKSRPLGSENRGGAGAKVSDLPF